jgi:ABC-type Mn2+/Zn2+ transport system ATPase subunit
VFNIKDLKATVPLGKMTAITGVSGSGKSSFMYEILYKNLLARLERRHRSAQIYNCTSFTGTEYVSRVVLSISPQSAARRVQTRQRIPVHGHSFVICSLKRKKRALEDGSHRDFHSTSKADDAKRARETERLLLKCTSCRRCMFCAMSARESAS